ncbi:MAG: hypothetical protein M1275_03360 [Patescibacteria group bacterium]|nr:hypothetical protein [Patescibacteria group bacterium]
MPQKQTISWKAPEYTFFQKSSAWYVVVGVIGLGCLIYAVSNQDYVMLITLGVMFAVGAWLSFKKPKTITITLNQRGVSISGVLFPFETVLKKFWIHYHPPLQKTLNFETTNYLNRDITLELEDQDPLEIRSFLLEHMNEDIDREETYFDRLLRALKF